MDPETLGCLIAAFRAPIMVGCFFLAMGAFVLVFVMLPDAPVWVVIGLSALAMLPFIIAGLKLQERANAWFEDRLRRRRERLAASLESDAKILDTRDDLL